MIAPTPTSGPLCRIVAARTFAIIGNAERSGACRAHRINELEVKRDQTVSLSELTVVFARWVDALREDLDDATFHKVLPRLRSLTHEPRPGLVGSADEWQAKEMARGTVERVVGKRG